MDPTPYYYPPPPATLHNDPYPHPTPPAPLTAAHPHHYALAPSYAPPQYYPPSSDDQLRTLFVAGLPEDVQAREIYNLFREFSGYESSHLRSATSGRQPFGFAVFQDQHSALAAMQAVNGMVFDLEKGSTLFVDFAKSNSRSKRSRIDDEPGLGKRSRRSDSFSRTTPDSGFGSVHLPGIGNSAYDTIGYPPTQSHMNFDGRPATESSFATLNSSVPHVPQNAPPCPTLFVASLGPNCSEQELIQVFSSCRGYLKLKMQSSYGAPVAFVDFQDTACSTEALNRLQGAVLYSSPGEGMRLEYPLNALPNYPVTPCTNTHTVFSFYVEVSIIGFSRCIPEVLLNKTFRYARSRMGMRSKKSK